MLSVSGKNRDRDVSLTVRVAPEGIMLPSETRTQHRCQLNLFLRRTLWRYNLLPLGLIKDPEAWKLTVASSD